MGELESVLDTLAADDLFAFTPAGVLDRTAALVRARNRIDAMLAGTVRHGDATQAAEHDGKASMASWLRGHCRLSPTTIGQLKRTGRAMEHLPEVAAGFAAGDITADQVALLSVITIPANLQAAAEQQVDLAEVDRVFARAATTRPHLELPRLVHHYLECLDPDGREPDPTEQRSLSMVKHADGSVTGRFELDAVGGEKVQSALEAFTQANRPAGDRRTRAQQLGDAFVQWADVTLAAGDAPILRTVKPHVIVTIPIDDLVDPAVGPGAAQTGFGADISAARARWLACDGNVTRIVIGPESQPTDLGRTQRVVPPHLRRGVVSRDKSCVFAGCGAPHYWCDVHHLLHWIDGGETSLENSGLLCERHHTKVHHGFAVERDPTGRWHTYRPDGSEIVLYEPLVA